MSSVVLPLNNLICNLIACLCFTLKNTSFVMPRWVSYIENNEEKQAFFQNLIMRPA